MGPLLTVAACAVLGFAIGRWHALVVLVVILSGLAAFAVLNDGFYGHGWGDNGIAFSVLFGGATLVAMAAGIALRRATTRRRAGARRATRHRSEVSSKPLR